jgi:protoporphyrinogen oxidase
MYYAARAAWVKRNRRVPGKPYNWATWFENMFGENLFEYAKRMKGKKKAATSS